MSDRFYLPSLSEESLVELHDDEFHHLAHVLRKRPGDAVTLFDGRGQSAEGVIESVDKRGARIRIGQRHAPDSEDRVILALAAPVPKGDRARWLIEKLTELGVDSWTPLQTARSIVDPGSARLDKLQQTVIAACKQCGRNRLLRIRPRAGWRDWLDGAKGAGPILVADRLGNPINEVLERLTVSLAPQACLHVAVGPEGGLTPEELDLARQAGADCVALGPTVLRVETAAIALAAIVRLR